jgi:crossover junction endodeoxyribonuclease RuvC
MKKILGIDPGSRTTGFAVLTQQNTSFTVEVCDVLRLEKIDDHTGRLQFIFEEITKLVQLYKPDQCAVETPVYGVDPLAMLKLGRAQAAAILAITNQGVQVGEYYPKAIKKSITGNGNASKKQVAFMLQKMLNFPVGDLSGDATDALAVAWCHFTHLGNRQPQDGSKKMHQNNRKSDWAAFVEQNPERVKKN